MAEVVVEDGPAVQAAQIAGHVAAPDGVAAHRIPAAVQNQSEYLHVYGKKKMIIGSLIFFERHSN